MKRMTDADILANYGKGDYRYRGAGSLRFQARIAHLDGRNANSREWNRRATRMAQLVPERASV